MRDDDFFEAVMAVGELMSWLSVLFYFCFCVYGGLTYFLFYCQVFPPQAVVIFHCLLNRCPNSKAACTFISQVQAAFHFASAFCNSCCEHTAVPSFATTTPAAALAMCMASGRL